MRSVPTLEWEVLGQCEVSQHSSERSWDGTKCPNTRSWDSENCPNTRTERSWDGAKRRNIRMKGLGIV